ncbi:MAG: DUF1737 domain-containing protein [Burkholderiaceae bacterium]|nr:DUF1737 domain-containing protein [Burkholderiaceae bacterium]
MKKRLKAIPKFANEAQERAFWEANDSTDHLDWSKASKVTLPNLKAMTKTISPEDSLIMNTTIHPSTQPPDGLPAYRLLTGPDDAAFCRRVSEALALGYQLYGSLAATVNGESVIVAQAIVWPSVQGAIAPTKT